jgi:hypothetical protein
MNTDEIKRLTSGMNVDVLALDQLPQTETADKMFIVNTEKIDSRAEGHWLFLAKITKHKNTKIVFMDALGIPPILFHVINYINININGGSLICNRNAIQSEKNSTCGIYAIMCANCLFHNISFESFLRRYSRAPEQNDELASIDFLRYKKERAAK